VSDILSFCLQLQIKGKANGSSRRGIERDKGTVPASISPLSTCPQPIKKKATCTHSA